MSTENLHFPECGVEVVWYQNYEALKPNIVFFFLIGYKMSLRGCRTLLFSILTLFSVAGSSTPINLLRGGEEYSHTLTVLSSLITIQETGNLQE